MFERFTDRARRAVILAQEEARDLNHNYIGTEHILLGLMRESEGVAAQALRAFGISHYAVCEQVIGIAGQGETTPRGYIPFTPRSKKVLELSSREARVLGHNYIGTEHILLGLMREGEGVAAQVLVKLGADKSRLYSKIVDILAGRDLDPIAPVGHSTTPTGTDKVLARLSPEARQVMTLANDEAQRQKHTKVTLSDLLVGHIRYGIWAKTGALAACGVSLDEAREHASNIRHQGKSNGEPVLRTRQVQRVIAHASQIATDLGSKNIEPEHLLVALVRFTDGNNRNGAVDVLDELGVSTATIEETIQAESVRLADLDEVREAIFDTVVPFLERVERAQSTNGLGPELMGVQSRLAAVHQGIVAGRRSTVGPKTPVHELPAQGL